MDTYHLIGIGGIGMSALARLFMQKGHPVQGSDQKESALISQLRKEGIFVKTVHSIENLSSANIVGYSTDIGNDHIERKEALRLGLPTFHRSDLLHQCMEEKKPLLVTGTHGKTTTSALLAHLFVQAKFDPSFAIGGICLNYQTNAKLGSGDFFIAEADESDGSFLKTPSFGAIVTNLENDHLSYWKTAKHLDSGFKTFFSQVQETKHLFWCADDFRLRALSPQGVSYGFSEDADCKISRSLANSQGMKFDLIIHNHLYSDLEISLLGRHNVLNASAAFALALSSGADEEVLRLALRSFQGTGRRLEWKGESRDIEIFDDYGHHPTEIRATISALRGKRPDRRLIVIFQPHRYSRAQELLEEFPLAFFDADLVIMTDIYSAGESPIPLLQTALYEKMKIQLGSKLHFFPRSNIERGVSSLLCPNDTVLTIGAGDITHAGGQILEKLKEKKNS